MPVKKKAGRPPKRRVIKKEEPKQTEPMEAKVEARAEKKQPELFPDLPVVTGGEEYVPTDPTALMRNGEPWTPEDHGYVARIMTDEQMKILGDRDYVKVPVESGIRFQRHSLVDHSFDGEAGKGVYMSPKQNTEVSERMCGSKEVADQIARGEKQTHVKLNGSWLCLAPKSLVDARRKRNREFSRKTLKNQLINADAQAQSQEGFGSDFRRVGIFRTGNKAQRSSVDRVNKTTKKIYSVPAQIK